MGLRLIFVVYAAIVLGVAAGGTNKAKIVSCTGCQLGRTASFALPRSL